MSTRLASRLTRSHRPLILGELKRHPGGLPVRELAQRLKLSYMGVKEHCLHLQKDGLVKPWRSPGKIGRPVLVYRITQKAREFFPAPENRELLSLLDAAARLYGSTAPTKLLLLLFQERTKDMTGRVRGDSLEKRARWLARERDRRGHYAVYEPGDPPCIIENHLPLGDVFERYPDAKKMEEQLFAKVLTCRVRREEEHFGDAARVRFVLG